MGEYRCDAWVGGDAQDSTMRTIGDRRSHSLYRFLFTVRQDASVSGFQQTISLVTLYAVVVGSLIIVPVNMIQDIRDGMVLLVATEIAYLVLMLCGVLLFWKTRRLWHFQVIFGAALFAMAISLIAMGGGLRGVGLLYVVAGYPVFFLLLGTRAGVALPLLVFFGMAIRLPLGGFDPRSFFQDESFARSYLLFLGGAALIGFVSVMIQNHMLKGLARSAYYDPVTGLYNRARAEESLRDAIRGVNVFPRSFSLLALKIHQFSRINSFHGSEEADEVLKEIGRRITAFCKNPALVSRFSGTVFLVILPQHEPDQIHQTAVELVRELQRPVLTGGRPATLQVNAITTRYPEDGRTTPRLLANLMGSIARLRPIGGQVVTFDEHTYRNEQTRYLMAAELRGAVAREELSLVYQPKISLVDARPCGAEVLVRWHSPTLGSVSPAVFIPLAEEIGVINEITRWVIATAALQLAESQQSAGNDGHRSRWNGLVHAINLSAVDLEDPQFAAFVANLPHETGIPPSAFEFEITEGVLVGDNPIIQASLDSIRATGYSLAVDDFGTGYSSLSYLSRIAIGNLKIDQSFVQQLTDESAQSPIIEAIIAMARSLRIAVTAEGVETAAQRSYLQRLGCEYAQGWLYAKPLPLNEYRAWITADRPHMDSTDSSPNSMN
ncbi:MAG: GGDEF domain-containing protein [Spirochaetaceae bacterium]|nr:MAG: GGDEF domain-containing protein [Spirochaetaceae bacterium]